MKLRFVQGIFQCAEGDRIGHGNPWTCIQIPVRNCVHYQWMLAGDAVRVLDTVLLEIEFHILHQESLSFCCSACFRKNILSAPLAGIGWAHWGHPKKSCPKDSRSPLVQRSSFLQLQSRFHFSIKKQRQRAYRWGGRSIQLAKDEWLGTVRNILLHMGMC